MLDWLGGQLLPSLVSPPELPLEPLDPLLPELPLDPLLPEEPLDPLLPELPPSSELPLEPLLPDEPLEPLLPELPLLPEDPLDPLEPLEPLLPELLPLFDASTPASRRVPLEDPLPKAPASSEEESSVELQCTAAPVTTASARTIRWRSAGTFIPRRLRPKGCSGKVRMRARSVRGQVRDVWSARCPPSSSEPLP
jgi:hypothetical protein